jgi:transposase-like protein
MEPNWLDTFRSARFADGIQCPTCNCQRIHRWGSFSGRQRYRCRACFRTFSDFTGTPAAYLKKASLLPAYAHCMAQGWSIRRSAQVVAVHPTTAFRWRHRLCRPLVSRLERLSGWIEITVMRFPESRKGQRQLDRPPRRRRWDRAEVIKAPVRVVVAADRHARIATGCLGEGPVRKSGLERVIDPSIGHGPSTIVAREGQLGPICAFARARGAAFRDARRGGRARGLEHVQSARAYSRRLVRWQARFRGVATKYLDHYLAWHRTLDYALRNGLPESLLRWPQQGSVGIHNSREQSLGIGSASRFRVRAPPRSR